MWRGGRISLGVLYVEGRGCTDVNLERVKSNIWEAAAGPVQSVVSFRAKGS